MLFCCSLLRWVCLALNVVGLLTLGITWGLMVTEFNKGDGPLCPPLKNNYKFGYGFFLLLVAWVLDLVDIVFLLFPLPTMRADETARQLRDDALVEEPAELILPCEESLPLATGFGGVVQLGARHGMQAEHRVSKGPDPRLASILPEVVRHSPRPPPVTHTTDVTASALEQEPGRAARLGRGMPPSPGLRHGAVAEVMGNATWPLVVGTDGGELCVAPERIVLRGPPRKLHHTARLLERASWLRCCAHGPRAVEAVALIPISRALCRSAVRVEGGPLAHVGVRGAEGRLRCVVEALCVKRGREVCGDAVALACATVVCAISPMAAAGVRRLGLRMIATQHAVGELFAAVHECRVSAGRRTDEKLLRSVRRWGRTALHDPAQDVCVFHHKLFHSASRCCWPQARAFRREVSKMGCKFTFLVYAILQLIAFLSVLIGTPLEMFRGTTRDPYNVSLCITLWGTKYDFQCHFIMYAQTTDGQWARCTTRRQHFRMAEALVVISIILYALAALLGFIMLFCCSLLRWVCLALNVVGLLTLGITWGLMVTEFNKGDGPLCPPLKNNYKFGYGFFLLLVAWVLDLVDIVFLLFPLPTMRADETARQLRDDALVEEPAELMVSKGPDPRLASILPEVVRHSPRPPPVTHTTDVTASALEQEPGRAARLGRGMRSTRVRVAPTAQHVPEGGDEQGQEEPVRRMARLKGRQCVLGDQDVAVAQQRPPSPGLRHGAVAEVMGNATWPLVVGTDGGELCVAPERIVLRGPPRKLHHTARLLERASWLRCCAHGPRAVEAVALIPISRALCRSAVRVEGGPLAHVGVRGAEGRLRCVVEALCVKRGREVCGDAVALACATVVCAISPMAAAGVRRLGLRMIATQHAVGELFAAVHECRVSAGRRTDEKLLRSVRRWGRTALHDPAQDVCVFHHKLFHSASRCCWPQARAFRREVSKMGCKFTFLVYAILQLIAFLSVLIGTPLEMFRGTTRDPYNVSLCITLWGTKYDFQCHFIMYAQTTDGQWARCTTRRQHFRMAEALVVISIILYALAALLGFIMLFCCSLLRWVCLALNVVGLLTLGITWGLMVTEFNKGDGPLCPPLKNNYKFGYGFFLLLVAWVLDLVDIVFLLFPLPTMRADETARQLRDDALVEEPAELMVSKGPDPRLASILPEVVRHSPRPPPVTHTTDVTASALEQEPGRAARLGRGMRSTRVRVAPTAQHVPEGGDEQGQDEPVRRMARLKGRQCVLGDQDVARIVLRGPPRKLHHTARLLERASWLRCCAHGPRAVEAVALIPISRALCRSAVRVEGGPLAHVGVRGAEGRLRCVVEALCVKRGREVCGDAVALACATVVCAISPMAAAGVRRLGLRMIAVRRRERARTDEKLLRSVRRWGRTALHDPAQDVCVFHHKLSTPPPAFRREVSKMGCKFTFLVYAILQLIAFLSVLIGTPLEMFRGTTRDPYNVSLCITLWGTKYDFQCHFIMYAQTTDGQWARCTTRRQHFRMAEALVVISIILYALAALLGFIMLFCCSLLRWVCLALNVVGLLTLGITWGLMVTEFNKGDGPLCPPLKNNYKFGYGFFLLLVAWVLDLVDIVFLLFPLPTMRSDETARQLRDDALVEEPAELILPCEESLPLATGFGGVVQLGARHGMQAEHRVSKGPDPRLASILPEVVRHSPRPPPVTHTTDVTASALEQEPGRAARLGRGMRSTRVRVAPTAQHVPEGGDEQGQDEPVRRMARLKGRQCVLGDQDVAVAQQRPPSPGLRHGAVAEVMGNATWPLVVGTDGGELCVAPERIVLRGPPRKLHHTARLLELRAGRAAARTARAPWRPWRLSRLAGAGAGVGVNHGPPPRPLQGRPGGPLAHVGVRGAEGRLRCVVEALCVKRGREVCGDAVALACATVVCAISPMAAAGVRRLGLRMIATQHAVDELFAAVHECRVSAGRRTDEKLLRSVRRWGRTALHDPAQDVCVFHHKLFHSASRCCWPQARAFRREVSKMGCKFTFLVYAILQLIAFLSVLIGTPLEMFRGTTRDPYNVSLCITLWGTKYDFQCHFIMYAQTTDGQWARCTTRRQHFRMAEALVVISIILYALAALLGFIMLFCCSLLRWVCLALNVVGLLTLGITWGLMVTEFNKGDGPLCPPLKNNYKFGYGFFLLLVAWVLDLVDIVFLLFPLPTMRSDETARQLRDDALVEEPAELILPCEESLPLATGFGGVVQLGARHGMQAEHRVSKGPDPRLASILPEVVRHSPRPPPVTHTTDVTASALEQEPGRAARLGRGMRSTRVRVAPTAQHVPEGGDEQGQDEPVRRMARLKGRQCVLGDQDVAVAQQRPPSPGLRHGAVAEVMGNATWPLVVGTDGGELCVAPERIVLRGPPRKLHHTARLLERASWPRCCAHGPRAVEAVALIPISRALCRSAVRVEGGPLAHVGVRGAEGRLRCVVEALCVKRGREVCGDAVALACATVVCAISPMAAAGVRRLGLRMIATQHAVDELFAAVHECRVSAGRRTDEKLLRSVRRWGRTALHDPAQDVCVFHHKLFHSASRCCWPQARAFRREVSKMGCKFTFLVYAILQLIAFLSVLIGTPLEMFRGTTRDPYNVSLCITLWGTKYDFQCHFIMYAQTTDGQWARCTTRRQHFRMAEALVVISIILYALAALLGFIMLFCCSLLRWVCLALNVVGLLTLGITWGLMVTEFNKGDGPLCPPLKNNYKFGYGFFLLLVAWVLDLVDIVFLLFPLPTMRSDETARQLRDDALVEEPAELIILPEVVRHSPRPPPVTHTTDVTASALEQEPGRAARLGRGMRSTRVRVAPTAQHVPEGGDEQGQDEPVRRMARLKGRQCVLGDQDVAVAQQRPPSPGLRHGAVAEVMGNATWPLVVGTDGGELCVAPERIVLRGPPRKLHHTARLLERASWPRCCAHGPRAVEAVALIPISRALCRSAVRVEGGPLAHVGVRGAEGRLRCVVEALCVKRGREVCGDAVALACATVVCAISPMAAAGVRRLGLRMIAVRRRERALA
ncbi:Amastin surface glycofamily protein [Leishmania donovani]|uniref:Amastin surface glycofamily protein n=1 Tax=Leishmania donovani TaxID=5661 RepID=A0A504XCL1_LEIDO|nr:Amastin surface glycofamily protein [Leishmania donovani]